MCLWLMKKRGPGGSRLRLWTCLGDEFHVCFQHVVDDSSQSVRLGLGAEDGWVVLSDRDAELTGLSQAFHLQAWCELYADGSVAFHVWNLHRMPWENARQAEHGVEKELREEGVQDGVLCFYAFGWVLAPVCVPGWTLFVLCLEYGWVDEVLHFVE